MASFTDSSRSDHSKFKKTKGRKRPKAVVHSKRNPAEAGFPRHTADQVSVVIVVIIVIVVVIVIVIVARVC